MDKRVDQGADPAKGDGKAPNANPGGDETSRQAAIDRDMLRLNEFGRAGPSVADEFGTL